MTVITPQTIEVLKNFCAINKSIVIKPGNTISTLSINKNILAIAEVQEQFESEISIYDLGLFVNGLSLFDQPKIDTNSKSFVVVSDEVGRSKTRFFYADPEIITQAPEEEIKLPDMDVHFHLDSETHKQLNKAAAIYQLPDLCLFGDGEEMNLDGNALVDVLLHELLHDKTAEEVDQILRDELDPETDSDDDY